VLTAQGGGSITVENDTMSVNLAAFIQTVKQRLAAAGFSLAGRIPQVNASFVLFQSDAIPKAQRAFSLLNTLGTWLPVIALLLLAAGVYVAADHRRALVGASLGVAAGMVVLALAMAIFRSVYLNAVPADGCRRTRRRCCTTPSSGSCGPGCARSWSSGWSSPRGRS
jgi:hypothetical protein